MSLTKTTYSMIDGAVVNVLDYGADPTGAIDSTSAIQNAIDFTEANAGGGGGIVFIPKGAYRCSNKLVVKGFIRLVGENYFSTNLFWDSSYTSGHCIELGPSIIHPTYTFGSRIENLSLSGQDIYRGLDKAMVYTVGAHQFSGLYNVIIRRFTSIGVHYDVGLGGPATFALHQVEIQGSNTVPTSGSTIGVKCSASGAIISAIDLIVQGGDTNAMAHGVLMEKDILVLTGGHFEWCTNGISLSQNESTVRVNTINGVTGHYSVPSLISISAVNNLMYSLDSVTNTTTDTTILLAVLTDLKTSLTVNALGGTSICNYNYPNVEPILTRKVSDNDAAFQFDITKRTQSVGSNDTILQITVPAGAYFIGIQATLIGSRAPISDVGTSELQTAYFTIARNGSGSDVVLNNNPGTLNQSATTTTAGGTNNKSAISPNIVRAGAEANTLPQVVNITVTSGTVGGTNAQVVGSFKVLVLGNLAGINVV